MKTPKISRFFLFHLLLMFGAVSVKAAISTNGLTLWLKADADVTANTNGAVRAWADQSTLSNLVSQTDTGRQPLQVTNALNGLPVLRFAEDYLTRAAVPGTNLFSNTAATVFLVQKQLGSDPRTTTVSWRAGNQRLFLHATWDNSLNFQVGNPDAGGAIACSQPSNWDDTWHVVAARRDGTNGEIRVDGVALTQSAVFSSNGDSAQTADLLIGNDVYGNTFNGDIAEILVYQVALTDAERTEVESYLRDKWSLPFAPAAVPDLLIKGASQPAFAYAGNDIYQLVPSGTQIKTQTAGPGSTASFNVKVENDGPQTKPCILKASESMVSGWSVVYLLGSSNITAQIVGSAGYATTNLPPHSNVVVTVDITMTGIVPPNTNKVVTILACDDYVTNVVRDAVQAVAVAVAGVQPDLMVQREFDPNPVGNNLYNSSGSGQTVWAEVETNQIAVYTAILGNDGNTNAQFSLKGDGGGGGWTVKYSTANVLSFDGVNDYVDLGAWVPGTNWTIEAWVQPSAAPSGRRTIAGGMAEYRDWGINLYDGQLGMTTRNSAGSVTGLTSGTNATLGVWYHLAGVYNGTNAFLYINGNFVTNGPAAENYVGTAAGVRIGCETWNNGACFPGLIKDVRIWNRPLSATDIQASMNALLAGNEPGLMGYWRLDDSSPTQVRDLSVNRRHGTLVNGPVWQRSDITAAVTGPGWADNCLAPGATREIRLEVTPDASVANAAIKEVLLTASAADGSGKVDAIKAVTSAAHGSSTPVSAYYTSTADFGKGRMIGVEAETVPNQLQLMTTASALPYLWVPNSGNGTVSKVDTRTGRELARYRVSPSGVNSQPSRTTVDLRGNCWLANRQSGTVVKIGLYENGQYIDRNGDGIIQTSQDLNNDGDISDNEMLPWGQDECVLFEVLLVPGSENNYIPGTYLGSYPDNYWNPGPRGMAVDSQDNLWAGTHDTMKYYYVDGNTGQIRRTLDLSSSNHTAYGAVIDAQGILWSSGYKESGAQNLLRLDPTDGSLLALSLEFHPYGLGIDKNNHLFFSGHQEAKLARLNVLTGTRDWTITVGNRNRSVAVTDDGDVWVVSSGLGAVMRFSNDGVQKSSIGVGSDPTGVAVDAAGKVWVVNNGEENIRRIDPATDTVDLVKRIAGSAHYGYSDMTGSLVRNSTVRLGLWTVIHDAKIPNTAWDKVLWLAADPTGTNLTVRVRSSNNRTVWSAWETAANNQPLLATPPGRYLSIEVTLRGLPGVAWPVLYDISATGLAPGQADLAVALSASPNPIFSEHAQNYCVTITNASTNWASGVLVTNVLATNLDVLAVSVPGGFYRQTNNTIVCTLGGVGRQSSVTITFAVEPQKAGSLTNTASVTANEPDPALANNTASYLIQSMANAATKPPAGLVGWWPGDGTAQDLIGTNHGVPQGGVFFADAKVNKGFTFDSDDDRVVIPHAPELNPHRTGFTVQFWMKGGKNQPQDLCALIEKSHGWVDSTGWAFQVTRGSGIIGLGVGAGGSGASNFSGVNSRVDVLNGRWHYLVGSWDGFTIRFYVDGVLQGSTPLLNPANNTRPLNLGFAWGNGSPQRFFRGQLDEIAINERALDEAEISAIYESRSTGMIKDAPALNEPVAFADGIVGIPYSQPLAAELGSAPYIYSLLIGKLPPGLNLVDNLVSGVPTNAGAYSFIIRVTDANNAFAQRSFNHTIHAYASPPAGLVGWWPAENNADDIASTNHGVPQNGTTYDAGQVGRAFLFDGVDDALPLPGSRLGALDITTNQLTIDAWLNLAATNPPATAYQCVFDKYSPDGYGLYVYYGKLMFLLSTTSNRTFNLTCSVDLPRQRWTHVAAVYNGSLALIYVDGVEQAVAVLGGNLIHNHYDACIGNDNGGARNYGFNGLLDEIEIFNRALSTAEIQALYSSGSAGKRPPTPADLLVKKQSDANWAYAGNNIHEPAPGEDQTKSQAVYPMETAAYNVKIENDGPDPRAYVLRAAEDPPGNWTVIYRLGGVDVTAALHGATGLVTSVLASGASEVLTLEAIPGHRVPGNSWHSAVVGVYFDGRSATVHDSVQVRTQCRSTYQPDLMVRREADLNYDGEGIYNNTGDGQTKTIEVDPGSTAVYLVQIRNSGNTTNRFGLSGSRGNSSWTVKYYGGRPSLSLNGANQYGVVSNAPALQPSSLTLEGWFNFSTVGGLRAMMSKTRGSGNDDSYVVWHDGSRLNAYRPGSTLSYSWVPSVGTWYHIAYSVDTPAKYHVLYVNGARQASASATFSATYDDHPLMIGAEIEHSALNYWFGGKIADVRLWSTARTQEQIQMDMIQVPAADEPGLAGYWPFNEGIGNLAQDNSTNGNDGVLINSPAWDFPPSSFDGRTELTADLTGAGFTNLWLVPGETYEIRIEVTPDGSVIGGFPKSVYLSASSLGGGSGGGYLDADTIKTVTTTAKSSTVPQGGTYTLNADFEKGRLVGVEYTTISNQLQLSESSLTLPFLWVPNSEGTISKVDTRTGREIGRYRTCPPSVNGQPSRTTVDLLGNCWVGNRYAGTVIKVGLFENGQYIDRNGNGIIDTSRDLDGDGNITGTELLPWGQDECVLFEVMLDPGKENTYVPGTYTGSYYNSWGFPGVRGIAVDGYGNAWVGTLDSKTFYYIDGTSGKILRIIDVASVNHRSYGAVIDNTGILWSSGQDRNHVLRLDPVTGAFTTIPVGHFTYGINADRNHGVIVSGWQSSRLSRLNTLIPAVDWTVTCPYEGRGIGLTDDGDIWIAHSSPGVVTRWSNNGLLKATIPAGNQPTGVAVDAAGKVWVLGLGDDLLRRIDPAFDTVDFTKRIICDNVGGFHYGYSDMTGVISRNTTTRIGTWSVIHNAKVLNTPWGLVSWHGYEPEGASIKVRVRSSNDQRSWSIWEAVVNDRALKATSPGKYLEVEVTLQNTVAGVSPVLFDLTAQPATQIDYGLLVYTNSFELPPTSEWSTNNTDQAPSTHNPFLGQFGNQTVTLILSNLPAHVAATVMFDQYVIRSWDGNNTNDGPDLFDANVAGGLKLVQSTFNNGPANSLADGQSYPGVYPGGDYPPLTGAAYTNTLGFAVPAAGVMDSVYQQVFTFAHSARSLVLNFAASGLSTNLSEESWGLDNIRVYVVPPVNELIQLTAIKPVRNGPFQMELTGTLYHTYVLQGTTNWHNWLDLSTNVLTANPTILDDTNNVFRYRFYRAVQQP